MERQGKHRQVWQAETVYWWRNLEGAGEQGQEDTRGQLHSLTASHRIRRYAKVRKG